MAKKPEWLKDGVGYVDVTLSRPAKLNNVDQNSVRMREPTVADIEIAAEMEGSMARKEIVMFANLCDVAPDDVRKLPMRDYERLKAAYQGFTD